MSSDKPSSKKLPKSLWRLKTKTSEKSYIASNGKMEKHIKCYRLVPRYCRQKELYIYSI